MKLKRTVSVILAFLMIMGMIPLSVLAASEDYEQIRLGETKSANILYAGKQAIFKFIPDEDGYYSFFSSGDDDTYGYIYDENMRQLATVRQFDVTVEKAKYITKLEVIDLPNKLDYAKGYIGDPDYNDLAVKATWSDGTTTIGEYRPYALCFEDEIADIDSYSTAETGIVKISCDEAETEFKVNLIDDLVLKMEVVKTHRYIENSNGRYWTDYNGGRYFHYNTYDTIKLRFTSKTALPEYCLRTRI